ncbi:hypothetical protein HBF32_18600 [Luteibacter yeojuensis]|uniref:Immunity protein 8 of polymorphic toxin system n=2 Tax=Luteibacter yeojuensis TaxID=345309 RepID=A0A7X5QY36_9GAMM|nr:hypothetical protein [Luteibacter yeojuensis]
MPSFIPAVSDRFGFWCHARIGSQGSDSADLFQFCICTPAWLISERLCGNLANASFGRNLILVFSYDFNEIVELVGSYAQSCEGDTWDEIATKLARVGEWEFDDYKHYSPQNR